MSRRIDFTLTKEQEQELSKAVKRDKRVDVKQRVTAIRMLSQGSRPKEVAEVMAVSDVSIYGWWHRYQAEGLEGLSNLPKGRPPRKADESYLQALSATLDQEPSALGYDFAIWTIERLRDHLEKETGVHLSIGHLRVLMTEQGYVYRRPKHDLGSLQDAEARAEALEELEALKKGREQVISGSSLWTKQP